MQYVYTLSDFPREVRELIYDYLFSVHEIHSVDLDDPSY